MKRPYLLVGVVFGLILAAAPFFATAFSMMHAFDALGSSGVGDPKELSGAISQTLLATWLSLVACPVGICLVIVCSVFLIRQKKSQPPAISAAPPAV